MKRILLVVFALLVAVSFGVARAEAKKKESKESAESVRMQAIKKAHPDPNVQRRPADVLGAQFVDDKFMELFAKGDSEGLADLFFKGGTFYPTSGPELEGRDAIKAHFKKFFETNTVKEFKFLHRSYESHRKVMNGWGRWSMTTVPKAGGEAQTRQGRFSCLVSTRGGKLEYELLHFSVPAVEAAAPAPAPPPAPAPAEAAAPAQPAVPAAPAAP